MEKLNQIPGSKHSCKAAAREDFPEPEGPSKMISFDEGVMAVSSSPNSDSPAGSAPEAPIRFGRLVFRSGLGAPRGYFSDGLQE
jgi:hypothetical protein